MVNKYSNYPILKLLCTAQIILLLTLSSLFSPLNMWVHSLSNRHETATATDAGDLPRSPQAVRQLTQFMHPEVDDSPHNPQSQSDKAVAAATPRWSGTCSAISFTVNVNTDQAGREDGSVDDFRNAIVAAADTWNAALENSIILHYNGATDATEVGLNGVNEVVFMEQGVGQPVAMSRTWVAADQSIIETDMWINTSYDWDATGAPDANEIDLQSVVLHEFGHWLTLPHADERASIMYPSISQNMVKRSLDVKDIDRIRTLYSHMQNTQCGSTDSNAAQRSSLNEHGTGWHSQWLRRIISS